MSQNKLIIHLTFVFITVFIGICFLGSQSLAQPIAQGKDKFIGNVLDNIIYSNFDDYWNQVTPGNAGKWGSVEYIMDNYNWTQLDNIYNYALSHDLLYKHHTLIWGQQYPSWITSLDSASQRGQVEEWIQLVGERYPEVDFVDVVNEPFHAPPPFANALGGTGTTGWDWVVTSFELARQYFPASAKLILNEYNILHSDTTTDKYIALIDTLNTRGLIDGIGIQGHYFEFKGPGYTYPISTIKYNLNRLVETGIPVYITEFDIDEADDQTQLENYQIYFPIFWEKTGVEGITLWGYVENDTWKPNAYLIDYTGRERPALEWLRTYVASPIRPLLISPVATSGEVRNPLMIWHSSETAISYNLQVSTNIGFTVLTVDTTITDTSLRLNPLEAFRRYYWHVNATNEYGTSFYSDVAGFITGDSIVVSVNEGLIKPDEFMLRQNYPNPFNPSTIIEFTVPFNTDVRIKIFDILGNEIKEIVNGNYNKGTYKVSFNADDLVSGIYFYKLEADRFISIKKLILLK